MQQDTTTQQPENLFTTQHLGTFLGRYRNVGAETFKSLRRYRADFGDTGCHFVANAFIRELGNMNKDQVAANVKVGKFKLKDATVSLKETVAALKGVAETHAIRLVRIVQALDAIAGIIRSETTFQCPEETEEWVAEGAKALSEKIAANEAKLKETK